MRCVGHGAARIFAHVLALPAIHAVSAVVRHGDDRLRDLEPPDPVFLLFAAVSIADKLGRPERVVVRTHLRPWLRGERAGKHPCATGCYPGQPSVNLGDPVFEQLVSADRVGGQTGAHVDSFFRLGTRDDCTDFN
jgi:hypothetical protein